MCIGVSVVKDVRTPKSSTLDGTPAVLKPRTRTREYAGGKLTSVSPVLVLRFPTGP